MTTSGTATQPNRLSDLKPQPEVEQPAYQQSSSPQINVGAEERRISLLAGAGLVLFGLYRRSLGGLALAGVGGAMIHRGVSGTCNLYKALGINTSGNQPSAKPQDYFAHGIHVEHSVTIMRSADELFGFWRNFENLPRFMQHLKSVECLDEKKSRWTATGPAGFSVQWDAEIINEEPNALIAWQSTGGADVDNAGSVRFVDAPEGRGTEVRVVLDYIPPAGKVGSIIAKLFGQEPDAQVREDLRRFKRLMETGEIATIQGQPKGTCKGAGKIHTGT